MTASGALKQAAGSLVIGGFDGEALDAAIERALAAGQLGGVILFRRNVRSADQVAALNRAVQGARPAGDPPLITSVDQEGGRVARLRGIMTDLPPMADLGVVGDAGLCRRAGRLFGRELTALGFNVDFAPVMDVHSRPENPVIGDRAFSSEPPAVASLATAFAEGLLAGGVVPCAKHFPGHGDTTADSHVDLPVLEHDVDRLRAIEWVPFAAAARAGVPMIMTGHLLVPALDPDLPATLSRAVLRDALRTELGYRGIIISDDLEMAAVADRYGPAEMARLGLDAGLDLFLVCHSRLKQVAVFEALVRYAERSSDARERLLDSARRVRALREQMLVGQAPDSSTSQPVLRNPTHLAIAKEIRAGTRRAT